MIAPEGGRSHVRAMRRAKPGVGFILQKADVPVVPVGLVGTTGDFIQRGLRGDRPQIEIRIGKPITLPPAPSRPCARPRMLSCSTRTNSMPMRSSSA